MARTILFLLICTSVNVHSSSAQRHPLFSEAPGQFSFYNPAALDWAEREHEGLFGTAFYRNQWFGAELPGAPQTAGLSITWRGKQWLGGAQILSDQTGAFTNNQIGGRIAPSIGKHLRVGLHFSGTWASVRVSDLDEFDPDDPVVMAADAARWSLLAGAGVFYSKRAGFFGGSYQRTIRLTFGGGEPRGDLFTYRWHIAGGARLGGWHWLSGSWQKVGTFPSLWQASYRFDGLPKRMQVGILSTLAKDELGTYVSAGGLIVIRQLLEPKFTKKDSYLDMEFSLSVPLSEQVASNNLIVDLKVIYRIVRRSY